MSDIESDKDLDILKNLNKKDLKCEFLPTEILLNICEFLSYSDLCMFAQTSSTIRLIVYSPFLWKELDLSNYNYSVYDRFIKHILLGSNRFEDIKLLSLQGCNAITEKSLKRIAERCPKLETILLSGCNRLRSKDIIKFIGKMEYLKKIELYGCGQKGVTIDKIIEMKPNIDLGLLWFYYCAKRGILFKVDVEDLRLEDTTENIENMNEENLENLAFLYNSKKELNLSIVQLISAKCRYEQTYSSGACRGRITGRIIYGNQHYRFSGNYPLNISYSCEEHKNLDFSQEEYYKCEECRKLLYHDSCFSEHICKVCVDRYNLSDSNRWVKLTDKSISKLSINTLTNIILLADKKNIPYKLKLIHTIKCDLDIRYIYENSKLSEDDEVPFQLFWEGNENRISEYLRTIKEKLRDEKNKGATRSLICYGDDGDINIYADKGVVIPDSRRINTISLTMDAYKNLWEIIAPIILIAIFIYLYNHFVYNNILDNNIIKQPIYISILNQSTKEIIILSIVIGSFIALLLIALFMLIRFRDRFLQIMEYFYIVILWIVVSMFSSLIFYFLFTTMNISFDIIIFSLIFANYGLITTLSFYYEYTEYSEYVFAISANAILAVFFSWILRWWSIFFIFMILGIDLYIMIKDVRSLPFIIKESRLRNFRPKIYCKVNTIRLRSVDYIIYGFMINLIYETYFILFLNTLIIIASVILCVCILPMFVKKYRIMSITTILVLFISILIGNNVIFVYIVDGEYRWLTGLFI